MNVDAVIPIRFTDCCDADGEPRYLLADKPLWDITVGRAIASDALRRVLVAYDDPRFERHLDGWGERIMRVLRPPELSRPEKTTLDVMTFVAEHAASDDDAPDYLMLLEISHPLRPAGIISEIVEAVRAQAPDSLVTCHRLHYNFWRGGGEGKVSRLVGAGDEAGVAMFQELLGIGSVFAPRCLESENPFGENVDIVPIDRFWALIDVRDEDGLWLAQRYAERVGMEF